MAIDKRFLYYTSEAGFLGDKNNGNISNSSIAFISVGGKKAIYTHGVFFSSEAFVVGTQTAATNAFTGTLNEIEKLYDGLSIKYWLPENGTTTNATLNLNINGTQTGAIPVYIKGTTRFTNHIGKYNVLHLTYRENVGSIAKGWWVLGSFGDKADGDTKYSFTSGTDGSFTVTPSDGSGAKTISIGKPEEAEKADVAEKVENAFTLQINSGSTEYEDLYTFDGSTAKTINIKQGSNIKIETEDGEVSISGNYSAASQSVAGLMSAADKKKLDDVAAGANKYVHPTHTEVDNGLVRITVDAEGHVSNTTAVSKADITALGIPGADTHYTSKNVVSNSSTGKVNSTSAIENGNVYLNSVENNTVTSSHNIVGSGNTTVKADANTGKITINTPLQTSVSGNAGTATKLAAKVDIKLSGDVTGTAEFDGSNDITITTAVGNDSHSHGNSTITSVDASKITSGTISIDRLPHGALERLTIVANDTARFALTTSNVQLGDTVKVTATGLMYFVKDTDNLANENGYEIYTAGGATSVPWTGVTGKPTEFTPSAHRHDNATTTIDGFMSASDKTKLNGIEEGANKYSHPTYTSRTSDLYKITVNGTGHVSAATAVVQSDITGLGIATDDVMTGASSSVDGAKGLVPAPSKGDQNKFLRADGTWVVPTDTKYTHPTYTAVDGKPDENATPGFGGTFTVTDITTNTLGHVTSGTSRTITIPSTAATTSTAGLMSSNDKTKLDYTNIAYGTCSTAAATAAKEITVKDNNKWSLTAGSVIVIKFSYTNSASNPTFNVNGTGARSVWYNTALITTGSLGMAGTANRPMQFMYDGTQFVFVGWSYDTNSTYSTYSLGIGYGTCATAADTTAKVVTLSNYTLVTGGIVSVKFDYNVPAGATMNINSKGAKAIYHRGAAIVAGVIEAGDIATFIYSTNYHLIAIDRATSKATQSVDGLMSSEDKTKLDGIATGANKYVHPSYTSKSSGLYKITVDSTGHVSATTAVAKSDITALGIPSTNTTYSVMTGASSSVDGASGLVPQPVAGNQSKYLRGDGQWATPTNTTYSVATTSANGLMSSAMVTKLNGIAEGANKYVLPEATSSVLGGVKVGSNITVSSGTISITKANVTAALGYTPPTTNTTYSVFTGATADAAGSTGLVPQPTAGNQGKYLRADGSWATPTNTTYGVATTSANGLMSSAMVTKLNGIADGANKYVLPEATSSVLGGVKIGSNITVSSGTISLTKANVTNALGYTPPTTNTTYSVFTGATSSTNGSTGLVPQPTSGNQGKYLKADGTWDTPTNTTYGVATTSANGLMSSAMVTKLNGIAEGANKYVLPEATSSTLGGVKVGSNITVNSGTISLTKANVTNALGYTPPTTNTTYGIADYDTSGLLKPWKSYTVSCSGPTAATASTAVTVQGISTTSNRYYAVEMDSAGRAFVNVPWTDSDTKYTLPLAADGTRGGIQIGFSESGVNVAVKLSSDKAYVALTKTAVTSALGYTPPTANTTYAVADYDTAGLLMPLKSYSVACTFGTTAATTATAVTVNAISTASNRYYAIEMDKNGRAFVNVPWTDNDTKYTLSAATTSALGGIKVGYTTSGKNYKVQLDSSNNAYVNVPWENTTYSTKNMNVNGANSAIYTSASSLPTIYAPTGAGTSGQILMSNGSGAPSWQDCGGKIKSTTASITISTSWGTLLSATNLGTLCDSTVGTYAIQIYGPSSIGYSSGIFTWNSADSGDANEILLHRTGASNSIYLRMATNRTLQIAASTAITSSTTITIKVKRLI